MKIHEFQAKQILRDAGVAVLASHVARSAEEAAEAYRALSSEIVVVKAQIHAGGRGKGTVLSDPDQHGVQLVRSAEQAAEVAGKLLGQKLVTIQTGPEGQTSATGAGRTGVRHRARTVLGNRARSCRGTAGADGVERRGRRDREGGGRNARADL